MPDHYMKILSDIDHSSGVEPDTMTNQLIFDIRMKLSSMTVQMEMIRNDLLKLELFSKE